MSGASFEPALDTTIECSVRAPGEARRAVDELPRSLDEALLRDAKLIVSELVTNSVRHSGSEEPIRLRAWAWNEGLKVEVADGGGGFEPGTGRAQGEDEGGRGLLILDTLTDRWGVSRDARTRVWFELSQRAQSGRRARTG